MNQVFEGLLNNFVLVYLGNITVFSKTFDDHIRHLDEVFARIKEYKFSVNAEKPILTVQELHLLGHVVTENGCKQDPAKATAITKWPELRSVTVVHLFLSAVGYYQSSIPNFSLVSAPLFALTQKHQEKFMWEKHHEDAFNQLKNALLLDNLLVHPRLTVPFHIFINACNIAVGAFLS